MIFLIFDMMQNCGNVVSKWWNSFIKDGMWVKLSYFGMESDRLLLIYDFFDFGMMQNCGNVVSKWWNSFINDGMWVKLSYFGMKSDRLLLIYDFFDFWYDAELWKCCFKMVE